MAQMKTRLLCAVASSGLAAVVLVTGAGSTSGDEGYGRPTPFAAGRDVLAVARSGKAAGIYLIDVGSGAVRRLTSGIDSDPEWRPDGARLAFARLVGEGARRASLVAVVDVAGGVASGPVRVLRSGSAPAWSRNGELVAIAAEGEIVTVAVSGRVVARVRTPNELVTEICWGARPNSIVFSSLFRGIFAAQTNGSARRQLTSHAWDMDPACFNGGEKFLFSRQVAVRDLRSVRALYESRFAIRAERRFLAKVGNDLTAPALSPDGDEVAYVATPTTGAILTRFRRSEIFVAPRVGGAQRRMTFNAVSDDEPSWRPMLKGSTRLPRISGRRRAQ